MGLWLSRPRVHDKVAVVSVISSTITIPGGPGGPGEKEAALECKNEQDLKEEHSVSPFESKIYYRCPSFVAALRYTNEYIRSDVSLPAEGESITSLLIFEQANKQIEQEHGELSSTRIWASNRSAKDFLLIKEWRGFWGISAEHDCSEDIPVF